MSEDDPSAGQLQAALDWVPWNRRAAVRATLLAALAVAVLFGLQFAVTAAVTSGGQPMVGVDDVPVQPQAGGWAEAPSRTVNLQKQQIAVPYGGGSVNEMEVRALTNESHVAFRLAWADPTHDANIASPENYSDAAALMFGTGEVPPITMGAVGEPVNIWYWRASWQDNRSAYGSGGMYAYPHDRAGGAELPGRAANNPLSRARYDQQAQNYYASGYGALSNATVQPVHAEATRTDDGWAVTFVRERGAGTQHDVTFQQDQDVYLAFAVWNGSQDERNGQKSLTLQYTKLNPESGALAAAEPGGGGSGDGGDGSDGDSSGGGSSGPSMTGWMAILLSSVIVVWLVSYWRFYE